MTSVESWEIVTNLITPQNLIKHGSPEYETLARCLGLLPEYKNGPAKEDSNETKVGHF